MGVGRAVGLLRKILLRGVTTCDQAETCCLCLQGSNECVDVAVWLCRQDKNIDGHSEPRERGR